MLLLLLEKSKGQTPQLAGQYVFEIKKKMFSTYVFSSANTFVSILSGDMGTFYGEGNYGIEKGKLILKYDSSGVAVRVDKGFYITPTSSDTLTILNIGDKKFDLECSYTGCVETYTGLKYKPKKNKK
jgi:hypothetical protein